MRKCVCLSVLVLTSFVLGCDPRQGANSAGPGSNATKAGSPAVEGFAEVTPGPPHKLAWSATVPGGVPRELALSPDGELILSRGTDDRVVCTRASSGAQLWSREVPDAWKIGFSVDGHFAFAMRLSDVPVAWDAVAGDPILGWTAVDLGFGALYTSTGGGRIFRSPAESPVAWRTTFYSPPPIQAGQHYRISKDGSRVLEWRTTTAESSRESRQRTDRLVVRVSAIPSGQMLREFEVGGAREWDAPALTCAPDDDLSLVGIAVEGEARIYSLETGDVLAKFGKGVQLVGAGGKDEWATWTWQTVKGSGDDGMLISDRRVELWSGGSVVHRSQDIGTVLEMWVRPFGVVILESETSSGSCDAIPVDSRIVWLEPRVGKFEEAWIAAQYRRIPLSGEDSVLWTPEGLSVHSGSSASLQIDSSVSRFFRDRSGPERMVRLGAARAVAMRGTDIVVRELEGGGSRVIPSPHAAAIRSFSVQEGAIVVRCEGRSAALSAGDGKLLASVPDEDAVWCGGAFRPQEGDRPWAESNNHRFAGSGTPDRIEVKDLATGDVVGIFPRLPESYFAVFSNDGSLVLEFASPQGGPLRPHLRSAIDGRLISSSEEKFYWNTIGRPRFSPGNRYLIFGSGDTSVHDQRLVPVYRLHSSVNRDAESSDNVLNCSFLPGNRLVNLRPDGSLEFVTLESGAAEIVPCMPDGESSRPERLDLSPTGEFALVSFERNSLHRAIDVVRMRACSPFLESLRSSGSRCFVGTSRIALLTREAIQIRGFKGGIFESLPREGAVLLRALEGKEGFVSAGDCEVRVYIAE